LYTAGLYQDLEKK